MWVSRKWTVAPPSTVELGYRRIAGTFWLQHSFRVCEKLSQENKAESSKREHSTSSSGLYIFTLVPCVYRLPRYTLQTHKHTQRSWPLTSCVKTGNIHRTLRPPQATHKKKHLCGCHSWRRNHVHFFPMGHYFDLKNDWKIDIYTDSESYVWSVFDLKWRRWVSHLQYDWKHWLSKRKLEIKKRERAWQHHNIENSSFTACSGINKRAWIAYIAGIQEVIRCHELIAPNDLEAMSQSRD